MDHRPVLLLAGVGTGVDHPSAVANIAALVRVAAGRPGAGYSTRLTRTLPTA
ncbi:MAG TPA: hypothetical protein VFM55_06515 [Micromonosporaceae bacterium]|nr:hypothetical protein [Micromonosporaceae bacterium]